MQTARPSISNRGKKVTVNLTEGTINTLTDGKKYADSGSEDMKGCFFSEGQLIFNGEGALYVQGNKKHGICSDDYLLVNSGNITITGAASDGIHGQRLHPYRRRFGNSNLR